MGQTVLIGEFLRRIKRPITLHADKKYKLVTVKLNHKGVVLRQLKLGSEIKSKMYEVKKGDFILSGIDARNGAFGIVPKELDGAIVTNDFWYFDIDESIVKKRLFLELTSTVWFDEICRKGSDGTTQRIRLQRNKFFNQEIILPPISEQSEFISRFIENKCNNDQLKSELTHQQTLLKKLRQQILQEAIEGKLTTEWRKQNPGVEPASELLKRIQAEKAQLIKDKKIKNQKPLPPISDDEKPFALPDGWVWCRLGDVLESTFYGPRFGKGEYVANGIPTIRTTDMNEGVISFKNPPMVNVTNSKKIKLYKLNYDDLLVTRTGSIGTMALYKSNELAFPSAYLIRCRFLNITMADFLFNYLQSPMIQEHFGLNTKTGTRPNINAVSIANSLLPLPPLPEQKAIIAKVEKLLTLCDQLETQITSNQSYAEQLMQAVLKEAFSQNTPQTEAVAVNA